MVGMGATSQTPHLSLDLGIVSSNTSVWNYSDLNIFVDLGFPAVTTGLEKGTSVCLANAQRHLVVDIGDLSRQEEVDVQLEPTISLDSESCQLPPGYIEKPVLHEERCLSYGRGESGHKNATSGESKASICAENCGTGNTNLEMFSTANVVSQIADAAIHIDACSTSRSFSKNSVDGSVGDDGNPNLLSAFTVFGIEGLDEEDMLAACQLLELGHENIGEILDERFAAFRLLELNACCSSTVSLSTNGEKTEEYCLDDLHGRSLKCHSALVDSFCTDIPCYDVCTSGSNEENDPWDDGGLCVSTTSDIEIWRSKQFKPYSNSPHVECKNDNDDDDWDILDRPPHKRQYKSLRQMYCFLPSST